jgi:hypothetical protein
MESARTRREHEVWQACDDLWALNASLEALKGDHIRDQLVKLGFKKGSPNEIYKYRQTWRESRGISEKVLVEAGQQTDPISRAVSLVYEQMQQETLQKINAVESISQAQIETLQAQNQELVLACEASLQKYETLEGEHEALKAAHETLREAYLEEQAASRELTLKLEGSSFLLSELKETYALQIKALEKKLKDQAAELSEKLTQVKLECRFERDGRIKTESIAQRLEKQLETNWAKSEKLKADALSRDLKALGRALSLKIESTWRKANPKPKRSAKKALKNATDSNQNAQAVSRA